MAKKIPKKGLLIRIKKYNNPMVGVCLIGAIPILILISDKKLLKMSFRKEINPKVAEDRILAFCVQKNTRRHNPADDLQRESP